MSCKWAISTDEYHGWECSITEGACMFLHPDSRACADMYGEGPDAQQNEEIEIEFEEEFDQECREMIEEWTRDITDMQQNFKNLWEEYLNDSDYYHSDGCTFEQEIRYVWRWCHDYQKILQIQDDISYVIVEDYF